MTGLEIIKASTTPAGEIADIISKPCPPVIPETCDRLSCRECWLAWLVTGEPPEEKGPSDEQTAPCGGCPLQGKKRELIQLGRLLKEVGEYVNSSPSRTSQSRYLPKPESVLRPVRDAHIKAEFNGYNHPELARKYNVTERWVRQLCGDGKLEGQLEFFDILTGTDGLGDTT